MKIFRLIFPFLLLTAHLPVFGQTDTLTTSRTTTSGFYFSGSLEAPFLNVSNLNRELAAQGYPRFDYPTVTPGFGFQSQTNRLILSFSYNKGTNRKEDLNSNYAVSYASTAFSLGRDFFKRPNFSLYPYVGYKTSNLTYSYREKINTTFSGYLAGTFKEKEITNARRNIDLGLGMAYQKFLQFGLKSGIFIPVQKETWRVHNNQVTLADIPGIKRNFYVALFVGFGFIDQTKETKTERKSNYDWDTQTAAFKPGPLNSSSSLPLLLKKRRIKGAKNNTAPAANW